MLGMQASSSHKLYKQQLMGLETKKLLTNSVQQQFWRCSGHIAGSALLRWQQASISTTHARHASTGRSQAATDGSRNQETANKLGSAAVLALQRPYSGLGIVEVAASFYFNDACKACKHGAVTSRNFWV